MTPAAALFLLSTLWGLLIGYTIGRAVGRDQMRDEIASKKPGGHLPGVLHR